MSPVTPRYRARPGSGEVFLRGALHTETDECILWPFGLRGDGYGVHYRNNRLCPAHRAVLQDATGETGEGLQAAHRCGVRTCVNPKHLYWATAEQNMADKISHGTHSRGERNGRAKLTPELVAHIRETRGDRRGKKLAAELGVSYSALCRIRQGKSWKHT